MHAQTCMNEVVVYLLLTGTVDVPLRLLQIKSDVACSSTLAIYALRSS